MITINKNGDMLNDITEYMQNLIAEMGEERHTLYIDPNDVYGARVSPDGNYYFMSREGLCPTDWQRIGKYGVVVSPLIHNPSQETMDNLDSASIMLHGKIDVDKLSADYAIPLTLDRTMKDYWDVVVEIGMGSKDVVLSRVHHTAQLINDTIINNKGCEVYLIVDNDIIQFTLNAGSITHTIVNGELVKVSELVKVIDGNTSTLYRTKSNTNL